MLHSYSVCSYLIATSHLYVVFRTAQRVHVNRCFYRLYVFTYWIQKFEADGDQRDDEADLQVRGCGIRGFVGQLCGERRHVRERWAAYEWKDGSSFCRGLG